MTKGMDKSLACKLEEFQRSVSSTAEDVVFNQFPSKIIELTTLISSTENPESPFHLSHASTDATVYPPPSSSSDVPESKKRKRMTDGTPFVVNHNDTHHAIYVNLVHANAHIIKLNADIKKECTQLADLCEKVKLWVNLTMPKSNFRHFLGVQIQEEVLTELHRSQESAYNLRDGIRQDYLARAKICSKVIKYPHVEDYTLALKEQDEKQLYLARQHIVDIRNVYAILTDIIHKNINKICSPKGNNGVGLY
ncbi:hypothetical protein SERLA73DRAFT_130893 [Serpula lacrymans var. lacrymans S7.3]|uniref:Proteasome activator PA28 C-terminal domain-containing protein n=2 Tax=Serpula lacrymans var. lacrymans TaxID=341189 RepID=F8PLU6_SERL3|nr:uncharacterized protein SERLADRAFT_379913 [Serpula lacrymans var. lacrymans S7.9]EGO02578.1 hypothetical protein SERLA73DRAFT_130893 [Serpula lacrymans var. lacrymans S7.3]EGO28296.1 hypothetical protein SERLADRAFT_379913 [Serpula lacrymans var. lacrymans S7.9]